ncbi:hypothetical protein FS749_015780 [Ceratobasidium sp. UAMH 11750]|nr:hypothetical protein FS749_015780 [Ceratobasidium sp. UAMH 11750]
MKRIPLELHLQILEYALSDRSIHGNPPAPVWPHFVLVCRSWRARVQEVVFRNTSVLRLQQSTKSKELLEDGLTDLCLSSFLVSAWTPYTHKLGDCIRSLVLHLVPPVQLISLLHQLPVLQSLTLVNELKQDWAMLDKELSTIPPRHTFPSVTGLYIFQSCDPEISKQTDRTLFIPRLVARFPSVAYLALEVCSAPSTPMSYWSAAPQNLVAFRSLGSINVRASSLITYFIMAASTSTLRVLKLWFLSPNDVSQIVLKHGATLECLIVYAPPKWPRNFLVTWFSYIRYFVNLENFTLGNLVRARPELLDIVSKQKLRHFEFVHHPDQVSNEVKFLKDCSSLVRVTYHYINRVPELDNLVKTRKIEVVYQRWNRVNVDSEP